jgi:hypothetical protein
MPTKPPEKNKKVQRAQSILGKFGDGHSNVASGFGHRPLKKIGFAGGH